MVSLGRAAQLATIALVVVACSDNTSDGGASVPGRPIGDLTSIDPQACVRGIGSNVTAQVESVPIVVHLPPCFDPSKSTRYPVVYLIHGASADASQWLDIGLAEGADALVADRTIAPTLWVMASFGDRHSDEIANSLIATILPWATTTFPTIDDAEHRAVGGISRGGSAAMRATIDHPDLFGAVAGHSPTLPLPPADTARGLVAARCRVWLDVGADDGLLAETEALGRELDERGLTINVNVSAGGHNRTYWRAHMRDYIRFYASRWTGS